MGFYCATSPYHIVNTQRRGEWIVLIQLQPEKDKGNISQTLCRRAQVYNNKDNGLLDDLVCTIKVGDTSVLRSIKRIGGTDSPLLLLSDIRKGSSTTCPSAFIATVHCSGSSVSQTATLTHRLQWKTWTDWYLSLSCPHRWAPVPIRPGSRLSSRQSGGRSTKGWTDKWRQSDWLNSVGQEGIRLGSDTIVKVDPGN